MNTIKGQKEAQAFHKEQEKGEALAVKEKIDAASVTLRAKAGDNGKLFGSITNKDVAEALKMQQHIVVDQKKFHKTIGTTEVEVRIYPEISAKLKVIVQAQ